MNRRLCRFILSPVLVLAITAYGRTESDTEFVDIKSVDKTIVVDLRYASTNNVAHAPLYPAGTPCLMRAGVARRLVVVQEYLRKKGYGLKIWDAYRPKAAQEKLWKLTRNQSFVADPKEGRGSMHGRGAAVDATLVDAAGNDVRMPTDFDNFTDAALLESPGRDQTVLENLKILQKAMAHGGFYGLRTEWWHFIAPDWKKFEQVPELKFEAR